MATYTTTQNVGGLLPEDYGKLIVEPVQADSVAMRAATVLSTVRNTFHLPVLRDDVGAAWVAEGAEITPDDATFDEVVVKPSKVGGLTIISRELADDSTPAAATIVGQSIARSIARQVDAAFFGTVADPAPPGLPAQAGVTTVSAGTAFTNLDAFAGALSAAETHGATITAFVANPADALTLATLKITADGNQPLLGVDATNGTQRQILGVPLAVSPAVAAGTVWAIPRERVFIITHGQVRLERSADAYFSSDRVGVRAILRVGYGFPAPSSIVKITLAT